MCAILDTDVAHEVFGSDRPEAGKKFFDWINKGNGRLAIGGRLRAELNNISAFRTWARRAASYGRLIDTNDDTVNKRAEEIMAAHHFRSDDPHTLALAKISGARLLYSNDGDLRIDFRNRTLIDNPRGRLYSTKKYKDFRDSHRMLLARNDLCQVAH